MPRSIVIVMMPLHAHTEAVVMAVMFANDHPPMLPSTMQTSIVMVFDDNDFAGGCSGDRNRNSESDRSDGRQGKCNSTHFQSP
jgi:hypothetical protein